MANLDRLPLFDRHGNPRVVVEVSAGSNNKFRFDPKLGAFLFSGVWSWGSLGSGHEARVEGWYDASEARAAMRETAHRFEEASRA